MALALAARAAAASAPEGAGRIARGAALLGASVRDALGFVRGGDARLLGAPAWWAFDAAVLWATFHALGEPPALAVLAFAYFAGQVGNTIPLPGAVSGGMVGTLLAFGVAPDLALSSVLAYRAVAIWLPAPLGLAALGALRSRVGRWSARTRTRPIWSRRSSPPATVPADPAIRASARMVPSMTSAVPCPGSA